MHKQTLSSTQASSSEREETVSAIEESAKKVLRNDRVRARNLRFSNPGFEVAKWKEFAELGWLMLRVKEARDGLGMGLSEVCAIAHQMGRELTPEPVLFAALIAPVLPDEELTSLLNGDEVILPAFSGYGSDLVVSEAGLISGQLEPIPYGLGADSFLVQTPLGASLVKASDHGVTLTTFEVHDGGHSVVLTFEQAPLTIIDANLELVREEAALTLSAYLLGVAEAAFEITLDYLRDREQFGKAIGSFQALQHKSVDLSLELWLLRTAVEAASAAIDDGSAIDEVYRVVSLAKARAAKAANEITRSAIQLHGGIGYTDEADIGLYLRKTMTLAGLLGSERFHRERAFSISGVMK